MQTDLERRILDSLMGKPLVMNAFRGLLVEAMLAEVLEPTWTWCSADWASHDFEDAKGLRLEVKQSSALQSWHAEGFTPNRGRFDIAHRKVRWEGARKITETGRYASIYIFAWHSLTSVELADHRDPEQWQFYVVSEASLPDQKTIGLSRIRALASKTKIAEVAEAVREAVSKIELQ